MTARININEVSPAAYEAVMGLEKYVRANVDGHLLHLIKLRASMLNGCSYCVDMHSTEALADGNSRTQLAGSSGSNRRQTSRA